VCHGIWFKLGIKKTGKLCKCVARMSCVAVINKLQHQKICIFFPVANDVGKKDKHGQTVEHIFDAVQVEDAGVLIFLFDHPEEAWAKTAAAVTLTDTDAQAAILNLAAAFSPLRPILRATSSAAQLDFILLSWRYCIRARTAHCFAFCSCPPKCCASGAAGAGQGKSKSGGKCKDQHAEDDVVANAAKDSEGSEAPFRFCKHHKCASGRTPRPKCLVALLAACYQSQRSICVHFAQHDPYACDEADLICAQGHVAC
jgi:hypothetical protein